ncbi:MAG: outer membrane beta-barrel family protein [Cyclobacteriaceae bacterium]
MNYRSITFILLLLTFFSAVGQGRPSAQGEGAPSFSIIGKLQEAESGSPVEFATISVFRVADSTLATGGLSDEKGFFSIDTRPGKYYLKIQFMGYKEVSISDVQVGNRNTQVDLGAITIEQDQRLLDEVVVQAERTQMELTLDKKIFNIGKDLSNLGGSATDILDNLPSVQVDVEGNVSLRGSDNVRILIDGKPSGLVGLSSNDALRQLNGNLVERVEIITNPSARYDAEGMAGIINIVLKKEKQKGINGSFQFNTGIPANHGASVNLNFRRDWVNFFTNFGVGYRRNPGSGDSYQEFGDPVNRTTERIRDMDRGGINYSNRFGADFFLNDFNTITLSFLYRFSEEDNETTIKYFDNYLDTNTGDATLRLDNETEDDENLEYSINYTRTFPKKGQKLTADFQYQNNNEQEGSDLVESIGPTITSQTPFLYQRSANDELEERLMLQSDYTHPLGQNGSIEGGFRFTDRLVGNDYVVEEQDTNGDYQIDTNISNDFEYEEEVLAIYGIASNKIDKLSWQLGLRFEYTNLTTNQKTQNEINIQKYSNFFPSTFLTYQMTEKQAIQMSYSRRISRPRGRSLNPFTSISDSRNFFIGNPFLQPVFTDSYEVGYLLNNNSSSFYTGIYYRHSEGTTQRLRSTDSNGITTTRPYNVSEEDSYGVEMNVSRDFAKWYRVSGNINFFRSFTPGGTVFFENDQVTFNSATATSLSSRISNNFKFNNLFDAQVSVNYRAPRNTVQGKRFSITAIDLGFSRDILKKNGTIALSVRDLLNSRKYRGETFNEGFYEKSDFQWRSRTTQISFTYRLNQKKQRERRGERGDGDDGDFEGAEF